MPSTNTARKAVPGWQTTEFWLTVIATVLTFVLVVTGDVPAEAWPVVAGGGVAGYGISRGIAKR